jgi:predicted dehydrogenase
LRKFNQRKNAFLNQEDVNVVITGVCDVFDKRAKECQTAASGQGIYPNGMKRDLKMPKRFRNYKDMLESKDIDAVVIATPDHWHAQMTIDAVNAGKHVYCEKCMTRTEEEVYQMVDAVKNSGMVFQLGHHNRQQDSYIRAREIAKKNILGNITLVETTTNRNTPHGAWVYDIEEDGNQETIDWDQFLGNASKKPFNKEHFFRWRCWFDYGTGLSGDLFSHEYDCVNQILRIGIPKSVVASGGIYYYKDGRDVPDVFHVSCEYPDRDLTLLYSATLSNSRYRGKVIMGHDAHMEIGAHMKVSADPNSTRFKDKIKDEIIDTELPMFSYSPGSEGIDAITSATEKYFASKGLMFTYREGKMIDVTHLHMKDWLECIRNNGVPRCNIDEGFQEAITCHMATRSYLEGRRMEWDPVKKRIV